MSPTVLRVKGYRFYFFSREEARPHVHVQHTTGEAKFWLEPVIEVAVNWGLSKQRLAAALLLLGRMPMRSAALGKRTSAAEVTNISPNGLWLLIDDREVFASFRDFPWFAEATVQQLLDVRRPSRCHLRWPALDVDLAVESLEHPDRFPLLSRVRSNKRLRLPRARPPSRKPRRSGARPRS